ncbi:two component transcriptional regulator, LuxR family [Zunongwangia mangrovi]|uniref:Two component transcriptional regulator, LuxR family n=1 Tax=Zunongwangia mangrovi TaxID=1334022 RepID=A0A1I1I4Y7_9FLAO|nr:response regulator transcription factor [Zunongwangia mangrovi]SFC31141.1 two component transcriptional regulator, LuxR family [Zunongwangia mangrovi]
MSKSIVIVDDHVLFGQSLKGLVDSFDDYRVKAVYKNGKELQENLRKMDLRPDLILLDIRMPVMDGLQTMQWLKQEFPKQKAMALTMEDDEEILLKMLGLGCRGYLVKDIDPDKFKQALDSVVDTGYYVDKEVMEELERKERSKEQFSEREIEFLQYVCTEMTYKEIAAEMRLSPKTIDGYRESLFVKLDIKSRVGLAVYAIKNNFCTI